MSEAKRRLEARRRKGCEPFATLRCDELLSAACALGPVALRVWLLLHANYTPPELTGRTGEAFVAFSEIAETYGHGRSTIAAAFRALAASGLIVLRRPGSRPRGQGAAAGEAAVWDLPSRHRGERPTPPLPAGVERPYGKVRLNAERLRRDLEDLSPAATKVFAFAVAHRPRDKDGALADDLPFALPVRALADALGVSPSRAAEAIAELAKTGRLLQAGQPGGRRPARFKLHPRYTRHERRGGKTPISPKPMVTTSSPDGGRKSRKSAAASVPTVDARV